MIGTGAPTALAITGLTGQNVPAGDVTETVDDAANDVSGTVQTTTADVTTAIVAPAEIADTTAPVTADTSAAIAAVTIPVEQTTAATAGAVEQAAAPVADVDAAVADASAALPGVAPLTADSVVKTVEETAGAATDAVGETTASLTTTVNDVSATPFEAASELVGTTTPTLLGSVDAMASAIAPEALAPVLASTDSVGGTVSGVLVRGEDVVGLLPAADAVTTTALVTVESAISPPASARDQQDAVRSATIGAGPEGPPAASGAASPTDVRDRPASVPAPSTARDQVRSERAPAPVPSAADFSGLAQPGAGEGPQRASAKPAPAGERAVPERYALGSASSSSGSSGISPILLATLAAGLLLVAPGLSRRLRLGLAPWPRPILQLSLERPG